MTDAWRMRPFDMAVRAVFRFSDGRTVFVGSVLAGPAFIHGGLCQMMCDDTLLHEFEIEREMIPKRTSSSPNDRSLSTTSQVDVDDSLVEQGRIRLVGIE